MQLRDRRVAGRPRQQLRASSATTSWITTSGAAPRETSRAWTTGTSTGAAPNGIYIPRYRNLFGDKRDYMRGFGYQGVRAARAGRGRWRSWGSAPRFKDELSRAGPWKFGVTAFGEMLPNHDNRSTLDTTRKDKWGLPVLKIDCDTGENER